MPETRLRIRMTVTALDGVKRFVMQYGSHARALVPEELRHKISEELSRNAKSYAKRKDKQDQ
ncbi:MAG TPA: WYL domain-containing protein [Blastocatellia bacterium]|nr:WYL domain-containing protein [Blastocatellia bacterium]